MEEAESSQERVAFDAELASTCLVFDWSTLEMCWAVEFSSQVEDPSARHTCWLLVDSVYALAPEWEAGFWVFLLNDNQRLWGVFAILASHRGWWQESLLRINKLKVQTIQSLNPKRELEWFLRRRRRIHPFFTRLLERWRRMRPRRLGNDLDELSQLSALPTEVVSLEATTKSKCFPVLHDLASTCAADQCRCGFLEIVSDWNMLKSGCFGG